MTQEAAAGVWKRLEDHSKDIHSVRERLAVVESKHGEIKTKYDEMCVQLQVTDRRLSEKLDILLAEYHKQQGTRATISWLPTIISCVVGALAIYAFMSGGA